MHGRTPIDLDLADVADDLDHPPPRHGPPLRYARPEQKMHPVRSRPLVPDVPQSYARGGYVGALWFALLALTVIWLLNGLSTAWGSRPLVYGLIRGVNRFLDNDILVTSGMLWGLGWALHVGISFVERHLWRSGRRIFYWLSLPCNAWDMLTASFAIKVFLAGSFAGGSWGANALYVLLGCALSLVEIPLIICLDLLFKEVRIRNLWGRR